MKAPCKGCPDRYPACHDHCKKYGEWRAEHIEICRAMKKDSADNYLAVEGYRRRNRAWLRMAGLNKK